MNGLSHCHWLQCHPKSAKLFNQSANSLTRGNKKSALSLWKLFSVTVLSYFVLLSPSPVDAQQSSTYEECRLYLAISDLDQNDSLDSDPEYIRFLNQWSRQRFGDTVFQELPAALQSNFQSFADPATGEINIRGTKPGNIPTQEEMERLEQFCDATEAALDGNAGGPQSQPTLPTLPPSTSRPTYAPGVPTPAPIYQRTTFEECLIYMAISDSTRDNLLSASEYVTFINNLGNLDYTTFNSLPVVIQLTYNNLSDRRDINIDGARLGEIVSQEQSAYLKRVCDDTELAIISALGGGGLPTPNRPTLAPATLPPAIIVPTNPPILPTAPPFIPTIAPLPVMTPPPSTSEPVPTASGDTPQPTSAQPISGQIPTAPPIVTVAPIASIVIPPGDGRVTINAAFIIASAAGFVTKEELENPNDRNRRGLATAFDLMVRDLLGSRSMPGSMSVSMPSTTEGARNSSSSNETAVEDALNEMSTGVPGVGTRRVQEESHTHTTTFRQQSSSPQLHPLHGRKLTIFFIPGGSDIFSVEDIDCDANLPSEAVCHKIFAGYELQATADEDLQLLYNQLVPATQNYIDQGELQKQLTIVDPTSDLSVVRSSYPVEWITSPPTASPKDGDDDDKERYILIGSIGGALFLILMASLILAIGCYCCQRNSVPTTGRKVIPSTAGPSRVRMSKSTRPTQVQVPLVDQQAYPTEVFRDEEYGPEDEETSEEFGTFQIVDTTPPPPKLPTKGKPLVGKQIKPIAPTKQQPTIQTPVPVDYEEEVVQEVFEDEPVADTGEAPWESESESSEDEGPPPPPPPPPTQTREAASNVQETEMETAEKHESIEAPVSTESKPVIAGAGEEVKVAEVAKSEMEKIADQPVNDESKVGEPKEEEPKPEEKEDVGETSRKETEGQAKEGIEDESKAIKEANAEKKEEGAKADETGGKDTEMKEAEEVDEKKNKAIPESKEKDKDKGKKEKDESESSDESSSDESTTDDGAKAKKKAAAPASVPSPLGLFGTLAPAPEAKKKPKKGDDSSESDSSSSSDDSSDAKSKKKVAPAPSPTPIPLQALAPEKGKAKAKKKGGDSSSESSSSESSSDESSAPGKAKAKPKAKAKAAAKKKGGDASSESSSSNSSSDESSKPAKAKPKPKPKANAKAKAAAEKKGGDSSSDSSSSDSSSDESSKPAKAKPKPKAKPAPKKKGGDSSSSDSPSDESSKPAKPKPKPKAKAAPTKKKSVLDSDSDSDSSSS